MLPDPVKFLKEILEIYSPSGKEAPLIEFLKSNLEKLGYAVNIDGIGNIVVETGKGSPTLLFSSHVDTIPGEIPIEEKDGKIYGRGAVDDKGTTAAMIMAMVQSEIPKGKLIYIGVISEENSLKGIEHVIKDHEKYQFDEAIFGEPTLHDRVTVAYKGRIHLHFTIKNKTGRGHVAASWLYTNPIEVMMKLWNEIQEICNGFKGNTPFTKTIPNITMISSGHISNTIPETCDFHVDFRFPPAVNSNDIILKIENLIEEIEKQNDVMITHEVLSQIDGYEVNSNAKILRITKKAIYKVTGKRATPVKKTGTTFMNNLGIGTRVPVISYGPGDPRKEHTNDEHISISDYLKSIDVFKKIIQLYFENK